MEKVSPHDQRARGDGVGYHQHLVDEYVDAMFRSSYSEAANSMAAIGMIIAMLESVYSQSFHSLGEMYVIKGMEPPPHRRWERA